MSEKYIKRTKKGKGRKKKDFIKRIENIRTKLQPAINVALSLLLLENVKEKEKEKKEEGKNEYKENS